MERRGKAETEIKEEAEKGEEGVQTEQGTSRTQETDIGQHARCFDEVKSKHKVKWLFIRQQVLFQQCAICDTLRRRL